jgi:hypothetical protein
MSDSSTIPPNRTMLPWVSYALLFGVVVLMRVPFLDHPRPVHGDEDEFVAAIGFPTPYPVHHPGYPLWVGLATVIHKFGLSPYASYQLMSVIGSGLLSIALCRLTSRFVEPRLAWWTGFAIGTNPLTWLFGTSALNYVFATALLVVLLDYCVLAMRSNGQLNPKVAVITTFGSLVRLDLLAWAALPCFLAQRKSRFVRGSIALTGVGIGIMLNIVLRDLLYPRPIGSDATPGLSHTLSVIFATSVFKLGLVDGLARSIVKLSAYLGWSLGVGILLIFGFGWRRMPVSARPAKLLLWLWCAPMTALILLIHASEAGHMLPLVPAIYLLLAIQLGSRYRPRTARLLMLALAACSAIQFLAYPWSSSSTGWKRTLDAKVGYMSAAGLRHIDERRLIHDPGDFWPTATHRSPTSKPADDTAP